MPTMPTIHYAADFYAVHQGKVCLGFHQKLKIFLPPGGKSEPGERPLECAVRELFEETGLEPDTLPDPGLVGAPAGLIGYRETSGKDGLIFLIFEFAGTVRSPAIKRSVGFDLLDWYSAEDACTLLAANKGARQMAMTALIKCSA